MYKIKKSKQIQFNKERYFFKRGYLIKKKQNNSSNKDNSLFFVNKNILSVLNILQNCWDFSHLYNIFKKVLLCIKNYIPIYFLKKFRQKHKDYSHHSCSNQAQIGLFQVIFSLDNGISTFCVRMGENFHIYRV